MPNATRRAALSSLLLLATAAAWPAAAPAATVDQQKIMIFGDSQAQGLTAGFQRYYRADREKKILDRSKISTGLARLVYDWPAHSHTLAAEKPDVAIALFGANDRPPVRVGGRFDQALAQRFSDMYGARVTEVAQSFRDANVPLIWVGHPVVRDLAYAEDMALLNDIFAERASAEGAIFLSTWEAFRTPDGAYSPYGRGLDGQTTRIRADDGVHMTPAGYDLITAMLLPVIEDLHRPDQARSTSTPRKSASL